jgi:D-psicose/D-tagatose/L-ribulose 3-epimerase
MQIGINLWVWGAPMNTERVESTVPKAAELGFEAVEIPLVDPDLLDYDRTAAVLDEHDLDVGMVVAMSEDRDLLQEDPNVRKNGRSYIKACIEGASAVGASQLGGPLYSAVGRTWRLSEAERAAAVDQLIEQLRELTEHAAAHDVTLCVEPLNRFETSFLNTVEQGVEVIDRIDDPHCQLLLDSFHMNIEEKSIGAAIEAAGDRIGYFHACANDRGAPGNGHLDWSEVTNALAAVGYDDKAVIESFTPEVESIANAAAIWRPLEESQDKLATDGLRNLQCSFGN